MAKIKDKVFFVYNEANILRLGAQLLLGVQLQETLDAGFQDLPALLQRLHLGATIMLLAGFGLLVAPLMFNRIVEEGLPSEELHAFTARAISLASAPFVLSLGVDFDIVTTKAGSERTGTIAGLVTVGVGLAMLYGWYLPGLRNRAAIAAHKEQEAMKDKDSVEPGGGASLNEKIMYALMETQMVLPGVQVLIAFQGGTALSKGFEQLPQVSKGVFVVTLALLSFTMLLLMMPATYHRYVEQGEATERFHRFTSRILLWSMVPFGLGMCGNLFVVLYKITGSLAASAIAAAVINVGLYLFWFGFMIRRRRQLNRYPGWFPNYGPQAK
jgi:hypothetical protein